MLKKLKSLFSKQPKWNIQEKHQIEKAFVFDGVQYYKFKNVNDTMSGRAFACIDYYNELNQRCTRDYLLAFCDALEDTVNSKSIKITDVVKLIVQLRERLEMVVDIDIVFKLASVIYFDETESPYGYDFKYGYEKVQKWKKGGVDDFFLQVPLSNLIPSLDLSGADLKTYIAVSQKMKTEHLAHISTLLSETHKSKGYYKYLD